MHKIYLENRSIVICTPGNGLACDSEADILDKLGKFKDVSLPDTFYIYADDPEAAYRFVCSQFFEVNAGGGLVRNPSGMVLMIMRNGRWDLPKGHQEEGEEILQTALREVTEETGLDGLGAGGLICVTDHCYFRNGKWHLKHSWWYNMLHTSDRTPVPQREEGISGVVWTAPSDLASCAENSYPSIREVLEKAGLL